VNQTFIIRTKEQAHTLARHLVAQLTLNEKPLRVQIGIPPSRSREQNAYLHLSIRALAEHVGMSETELKEVLKAEYGPTVERRVGTKTYVAPKSMGDYSSAEAATMIDHVERIGADCGILLSPEASW
jgi:hypothetical protein